MVYAACTARRWSKVSVVQDNRIKIGAACSIPNETMRLYSSSSVHVETGGKIESRKTVIVGFQTGKDANQTQNPSLFDHLNLTNMYVMLNSARYPEIDYILKASFWLGYTVMPHRSDPNSIT